jgi:hypothetical protein
MRRMTPLARPPLSLVLLVLVATGCGGGAGAPAACPLTEGDGAILGQALEGRLDPQPALEQVARSGGWPIRTSCGFVFAQLDRGQGPYSVESPGGAFPPTVMTSRSGLAWALVPIATPEGASYRFSNRYAPLTDPVGRHLAYAGGEEVQLVRPAGPHLERWPFLGAGSIGPRWLRIWVPARTPTHHLYAHDGQNLFPGGPFGGWDLQVAAGPATLVVGIDNTSARLDEYTPVQDLSPRAGGQAAAYADYLSQTVRPFVEDHFGIPARRGVMGSSLGGLVSYFMALRQPGAWDYVASLSGTMGWGSIEAGLRNKTMIEDYAALASCPAAVFYLDSGGGPGGGCVDADGDGIEDDAVGSADNYCENAQLKRVLEVLGCGPRLAFVWAPNAPHNEAAWRDRVGGVLARFEAL